MLSFHSVRSAGFSRMLRGGEIGVLTQQANMIAGVKVDDGILAPGYVLSKRFYEIADIVIAPDIGINVCQTGSVVSIAVNSANGLAFLLRTLDFPFLTAGC